MKHPRRRPPHRRLGGIRNYTISTARGQEGRLLELRVDCARVALRRAGARCYELLEGRTNPCPGCPALAHGDVGIAVMARRARGAPAYRLIVARRHGTRKASVCSMGVDDDILPQLIAAKVERLAEKARLTSRELSVLHLVVLGRYPRDIAVALGVSRRTVKFHQLNLLAKLGADSRADVLRLLLLPG
jgi:DNA-binding CsgD family transcriptional regulator